MPFGLKNAPAAFQRCMQDTLAHLSVYSSAYIDDILIYSKNWEGHLDHIDAVLLALREAGLTANPDKCVWGEKSLEYLGHKIGYGMVGVPEARVKALKDYIKPGQNSILHTMGQVCLHAHAIWVEKCTCCVPEMHAEHSRTPFCVQLRLYR